MSPLAVERRYCCYAHAGRSGSQASAGRAVLRAARPNTRMIAALVRQRRIDSTATRPSTARVADLRTAHASGPGSPCREEDVARTARLSTSPERPLTARHLGRTTTPSRVAHVACRVARRRGAPTLGRGRGPFVRHGTAAFRARLPPKA